MNSKLYLKQILFYVIAAIVALSFLFFRFYSGKNGHLIEVRDFLTSLDALAGVLIGAAITYWFNLRQNTRIIDQEAKTFARYILIVLDKQGDILKEIKNFSESHSNWQPREYPVTELSFEINQDILNRILLSEKFESLNQIDKIMDHLISAEDCFKKCISWITLFNGLYEKTGVEFEKFTAKNIFDDDVKKFLESIRKAHREAMKANDLAIKKFHACMKSFKGFETPKRKEIISLNSRLINN